MTDAPACVRLPRRGERPLTALLSRANRVFTDGFGTCRFIITLLVPAARFEVDEASLRMAFDLSPTEAKLVARLAAGDSLQECSRALRISYENGRIHMKRIFSKLGVHRQAELMLLVTSLKQAVRPL